MTFQTNGNGKLEPAAVNHREFSGTQKKTTVIRILNTHREKLSVKMRKKRKQDKHQPWASKEAEN